MPEQVDMYGPVRWTFGCPLMSIYDSNTGEDVELGTPERQQAVLTALDQQLHIERAHPNVLENHDLAAAALGKAVTYRTLSSAQAAAFGYEMVYDRALLIGVRLVHEVDEQFVAGKLRSWSPRIRFDSKDEIHRLHSARLLEHSAVGIPLFKNQIPADVMLSWDLDSTPILTAGDSMAAQNPKRTLTASDGMPEEMDPMKAADGGGDMEARMSALEAAIAEIKAMMSGPAPEPAESEVTAADLGALRSQLDLIAGEQKRLLDERRRDRVEAVVARERMILSEDPATRAAQVGDLIAADAMGNGSFERAVSGWAKAPLRADGGRTAGVGGQVGGARKFRDLTGSEKRAAVSREIAARDLTAADYESVFVEMKRTNPEIAA